jgi:hypothetical protein
MRVDGRPASSPSGLRARTRSVNRVVTGGDGAWFDRRGGVRFAASWAVNSALMAGV